MDVSQPHELTMPELESNLGKEAQQFRRADVREAGDEHLACVFGTPGFFNLPEQLLGVVARVDFGKQSQVFALRKRPGVSHHHLAASAITQEDIRQTLNGCDLPAPLGPGPDYKCLGLKS